MQQTLPDTTEAPTLEQRLAVATSVVFHPAVLPTWAFGALLGGHFLPVGIGPAAQLWVVGLVSLITLFLPVAMLSVAHYFGIITDWQLRPKGDRQFGLWLIVGLYASSTYMLQPMLPILIFRLLAGISALAIATAGINIFYRISGHAMAIAAFLGYWGSLAQQSGNMDLLLPLVATLLATGVVAWARLTLQAHTVGQVLYGLALGLLVGVGVAYW
jgi:membrane-associated phospholipid phosphatase